jgi:hypothetical protein
MADDKSTASEPGKKEQAKEPAEEKVERERLIAESHQFFGFGPHVVAGALYGLDDRATAFKPSDVEEAIEKFLKRKVKEA